MTNKLIEICDVKRQGVARRKATTSIASLQARAAVQTPPRGFRRALDTSTRLLALFKRVKLKRR